MASNDQLAGPSKKRIKLDSTEPVMDVRSINKLFPKIDNLEHFPLKVLLKIFANVGDIDLYNLAEKSQRFENIAKMVLNERYAHEYFILDACKKEWIPKSDQEHNSHKNLYTRFFRRFGKTINAIEMKHITLFGEDIENHWVGHLLNKAKNLKKFTIFNNVIHTAASKNLLQLVGKSITHLRILDTVSNYVWPEYHNLQKLELKNVQIISIESMAQILRNNTALESLILGDSLGGYSVEFVAYPFGELMILIGTYLNQLKEFGYVVSNRETEFDDEALNANRSVRQPAHIVDKFVSSLKYLESFALSSTIDTYADFYDLLRRMGLECKSIKQLKLYDIDDDDVELCDIIRSFRNIESLTLEFTDNGDEVESLIEHLPHLRDLDIKIHEDIVVWSFVLELFRKFSSLETLTIATDNEDADLEEFGTRDFYDQFIESIQKPNVKMVVKLKDEVIGSISKNEVTWRNKLVHWIGDDRNSSNINLLDLAKKPQDAKGADRPSPFNLILDYLDLNSLCSLCQTNKKCLQLVGDYVKQHSQQHGTFTVTNEFNSDFDDVEMFAEYVTNLRANIVQGYIDKLYRLFKTFRNLKKLYISTELHIMPYKLIVPHVRHLIYDGPGLSVLSDLYKLSRKRPDLQTLELKRGICRDVREIRKQLKFRELKDFKLKYNNYSQRDIEILKAVFKDTKLILNV